MGRRGHGFWDIMLEIPMTIAHVAERDPELVYGTLLFSLMMSTALIWIVFRFVLRSKQHFSYHSYSFRISYSKSAKIAETCSRTKRTTISI